MSDRSLNAQTLLAGYASGIFPMSHDRNDPEIFWVRPEERGIIPLDGFHLSRSLKKRIRKDQPVIRVNSCFPDILRACADREETWINQRIFDLYCDLHDMGFAHSVEVFTRENELWGGVYGVSMGGAFFGESMFSTRTDGSKIALTFLVARLNAGGYRLFDAQFQTDHLASLGAIEISRSDYEMRLKDALGVTADFFNLPASADFHSVMQLTTQTS